MKPVHSATRNRTKSTRRRIPSSPTLTIRPQLPWTKRALALLLAAALGAGAVWGYGAFKQDAAEAVVSLLDPIRLRYGELRGDSGALQSTLAKGAEKAETIAAETLALAYERVGFVAP